MTASPPDHSENDPLAGSDSIGSLTIDAGSGETIEIVNFRPELAPVSGARERTKLVKALADRGLLRDEDARHTVARGVIRPELAGQMVSEQLTAEETVGPANLSHIAAHVLTTELWALINPRTNAGARTARHPIVRGVVDDQGQPEPLVEMEFVSMAHLAQYMHETIANTRRTGNDYTPSILARRISRPLLVHVVRLTFTDGSPSFTVLAVRDGLTRLVSGVAGRMGGNPSPTDVADRMVDDLMAFRKPRGGKQIEASRDHARGREQVLAELRATFAAGMAGQMPSEQALRIGQTYSAPAQVYVGVRALPSAALPADQVFVEAVRGVVGSIHTEFKPWDAAAQASEVGERALQRAQHDGVLSAEIVELAGAFRDVGETGAVFGDPAIPGSALWRATFLTAALTGPAFHGVKAALRPIAGMRSIQNKRYMSYLGPIIDLPWRAAKVRSLQGARRAWAGGGPVPTELMGQQWTPVPTEDFLTLVEAAIAGDGPERRTLQVAGGIALIADRLLPSNVGSSVDSGDLPYRSDPHDIVARLGTSEAGLFQLARAANAFSPDRAAINSFSPRDFAGDGFDTGKTYQVPAVDPETPAQYLRDASGAALSLTQYLLFALADPDRTKAAEDAAESNRRASSASQSPEAQVDRLRQDLAAGLTKAEADLTRLLALTAPTGQAPGDLLSNYDQWVRLRDLSSGISAQIHVNAPGSNTDDSPFDDTDDNWENDQ